MPSVDAQSVHVPPMTLAAEELMDLKDSLRRAVEAAAEPELRLILALHAGSAHLPTASGEAVLAAVASGRTDLLRLLLDAGANPNAKDRRTGLTALHLAIKRNHADAARLLLERGAAVNEPSKHTSTALYMAVESEQSQLVRLVLEHRGDVRIKKLGCGLLHLAVERGNVGLARLLLERGCSADEADVSGGSALHIAVEERNVELVRLLLASGAGIGRKKYGRTPLQLAVKSGCLDIVDALLRHRTELLQRGSNEGDEQCNKTHSRDVVRAIELAMHNKDKPMAHCLLNLGGADVNVRVSDKSLVHRSIQLGWLDTLRLLMEQGACLENSALLLAVKVKSIAAVELLLKSYPADVNAREAAGTRTPLHVAFGTGCLELVELLLRAGADPRLCYGYGKRPLEVAIEQGWLDLAHRLLHDYGIDPNSEGFDGARMLLHAVRSHNARMVRLLLQAGADPNADPSPLARYMDNKIPALVLALELRSSKELVQELLDHGASPDVLDPRSGKSVLQLAVIQSQEDIAGLLAERGANLDYRTTDRSTALLYGLDKCARAMVTLLLRHGANVKLRRPGCPTPLRRAISLDWQAVVQLMLDLGAARDERPANLIVPLYYAVFKGDARMYEQLVALGADPLFDANSGGRTLLHTAAGAWPHCPAILEDLLRRGVDVDVADLKNTDGLTPLHYALLCGVEDSALLLLDRGASIQMRERYSQRGPLHLAAEKGCMRVARRLLGLLPVDGRSSHGVTPLQIAAMCGQPRMAELLVGYGAGVDLISGRDHFSPLHCAICHRGFEVAELLLETGALGFGCRCHPSLMDLRAKPERSPFGYARRNRDCPIMNQLLLQYDLAPLDSLASTYLREEMLSYLGSIDSLKPLARVYIKHIVRKNMWLGRREREGLCKPMQELLESCISELERMQHDYFYERVSISDVLCRSIDSLRGFVRNESLVRALEDSGYRDKYPLYEDILTDSMSRARKLESQYVNCERLLYSLFQLPYELGRKILNLLDVKDVRNFNNVLPDEDDD